MDLALNNLQRLICHKTQQTKPKLDLSSEEASFVVDAVLITASINET